MWHRVYPGYNFVVNSVLILDDKLASRTVGDNASYHIDGSTDHFVAESNSCVSQDERSCTISPQQEDNGRSGGSRDSAGGNEGSICVLICHVLFLCPQ